MHQELAAQPAGHRREGTCDRGVRHAPWRTRVVVALSTDGPQLPLEGSCPPAHVYITRVTMNINRKKKNFQAVLENCTAQ